MKRFLSITIVLFSCFSLLANNCVQNYSNSEIEKMDYGKLVELHKSLYPVMAGVGILHQIHRLRHIQEEWVKQV